MPKPSPRAVLHRAKNAVLGQDPAFYRYSAVEFLFWFASAAASFTVVFLQENGMTSDRVGQIMASLNALGIIAPPIWGMVSDRLRSSKKVLILCLGVGSLVYALLPGAYALSGGSIAALVTVLALSSFFRNPATSLKDSWIISGVNATPGLKYGTIRLWGSIGYAIMCYGIGVFMARTGTARHTFYIYALMNIPLIILLMRSPDHTATTGQRVSFRDLKLGRLFKNYYLVTFLVANMALSLPMYATYTFLPYLLTDISGSSQSLGNVFAVKALMEVPTLLAAAWLTRKVGIRNMIFISGALYMAEQLLYMLCGATWQVMGVMMINGLASGVHFACSINYLYRMAPEGLSATAQTVNGAMGALAGILGNAIGGQVVAALGIRSYFGLAGALMLVVLSLFAASFVVGSKILKIPLPVDVLSERRQIKQI